MRLRRKKKLKIFTKDVTVAGQVRDKLNRMGCNHFYRLSDGWHIFTPTRFHKKRFEKIMPWLQSQDVRLIDVNKI